MNFPTSVVQTPLVATLLAAAPVGPTIPATHPVDPSPGWFGMLQSPIFLIGGLFLVVTLLGGKGGSKRAEEKARAEGIKGLKAGDRIQTTGGVLGAVVKVEEARVQVKVDESNNVKMWFTRTAIWRVVDADKAEK